MAIKINKPEKGLLQNVTSPIERRELSTKNRERYFNLEVELKEVAQVVNSGACPKKKLKKVLHVKLHRRQQHPFFTLLPFSSDEYFEDVYELWEYMLSDRVNVPAGALLHSRPLYKNKST